MVGQYVRLEIGLSGSQLEAEFRNYNQEFHCPTINLDLKYLKKSTETFRVDYRCIC